MLVERLAYLAEVRPDLVQILPAAIFPAIIAIYALYFRRAARHSSQHRIAVVDHSQTTLRVFALKGKNAENTTPKLQNSIDTLHIDRRVIDDLVVNDNTWFPSPLKVEGDLVIDGHGIFDQIVVVDGHVQVNGSAWFHKGLVCKSGVHIEGVANFGDGIENGWCIADHCNYERSETRELSSALAHETEAA